MDDCVEDNRSIERELQLSAASGGKQKIHPKNGWSFLTENFSEYPQPHIKGSFRK